MHVPHLSSLIVGFSIVHIRPLPLPGCSHAIRSSSRVSMTWMGTEGPLGPVSIPSWGPRPHCRVIACSPSQIGPGESKPHGTFRTPSLGPRPRPFVLVGDPPRRGHGPLHPSPKGGTCFVCFRGPLSLSPSPRTHHGRLERPRGHVRPCTRGSSLPPPLVPERDRRTRSKISIHVPRFRNGRKKVSIDRPRSRKERNEIAMPERRYRWSGGRYR